ncbi:mRNA-degrading endonuclease [Lewinellaceae bacterium SD302]|nr:mRNA-degrading endonuclease [Lewinellaceae bacterium SD302]
MARYLPRQKDIISLRLPGGDGGQLVTEQLFLVISATAYNRLGKCILVPISKEIRDLRTEVNLPVNQKTKGVIVADQCRSLDWRYRWPKKRDQLSDNVIFRRVTDTIAVLLALPTPRT